MRPITLLAATAFFSICSAQSTVNLFLPDADDDDSLIASAVKSDATATTYSVGCPTTVDDVHCGFPFPFAMTQGPSTVNYAFGIPDSMTYSMQCVLGGTTSIDCTQSAGGPDVGSLYAGVSTIQTTGSEISSLFLPVPVTTNAVFATYGDRTVTFGNDEPSSSRSGTRSTTANAGSGITSTGASRTSSSAPASTAAASSSSSVASSTTNGPRSSSSAAPAAGSSTSATASASKSSTGGVPQVTENAGLVIGGMAVAVAFAAL